MSEPRSARSASAESPDWNNSRRVKFPVLRWIAVAWLIIWIPAYWRVWGWRNFLHLCDAAVIISCIGLIFGSRLLVSSQALATVITGIVWSMDVSWRLATNHYLTGGTEYLWDGTQPLWVRLLSLFHVALPILLVVICARIGYDRRALALQSGITAALITISRWFGPELNLNYAFRDPILHRALGPAPVHLAIIFACTVLLFYLPTHIILNWKYSGRGEPDRLK
jgi:hypothetical protein